MKPFRRILLLTVISLAIVLFWLIPGVNTARETKYTRTYEDTDRPVAVSGDSVPQKVSPGGTSKKYKTESIEADAALSDIKPSMFSRAIHFEEALAIEELQEEQLLTEVDSLEELEIALLDSIEVAAIDTLARLE